MIIKKAKRYFKAHQIRSKFLDTYTVLHEYYLSSGKGSKAYNLMQKGYDRAINLVLNKNGRFLQAYHGDM